MGLARVEESVFVRIGRLLAASAAAALLSACSINFPMMSLVGGSEPESTGSIEPVQLSRDFDTNDRKLAMSALDTALDPRRAGGPVPWSNPFSGLKGVVSPTGEAFVTEDQVCRWFAATVTSAKAEAPLAQKPSRVTGYACRVGGGSWTIRHVEQAEAPQG